MSQYVVKYMNNKLLLSLTDLGNIKCDTTRKSFRGILSKNMLFHYERIILQNSTITTD